MQLAISALPGMGHGEQHSPVEKEAKKNSRAGHMVIGAATLRAA